MQTIKISVSNMSSCHVSERKISSWIKHVRIFNTFQSNALGSVYNDFCNNGQISLYLITRCKFKSIKNIILEISENVRYSACFCINKLVFRVAFSPAEGDVIILTLLSIISMQRNLPISTVIALTCISIDYRHCATEKR